MLQSLSDEIWKLRGCVSDLVSLLGLPAVWRGGTPGQIVNLLGDVLQRMLKLDFVYTRLEEPMHESLHVAAAGSGASRKPWPARQVGLALAPWLVHETAGHHVVANPVGAGDITIAVFDLGREEHHGTLVAASQRAGFPTYIDTLLLRVAVTLALPDLMRARMLAEQGRATTLELEQHRLRMENLALRLAQNAGRGADKLIGRSVAAQRLRQEAGAAGAASGCVLVCGEVGAGKELVARVIHRASSRSQRPFVKLDCAGTEPQHLEAELFGSAPGAARAVPGHCRMANGGVLFLDHVDQLPMDLQERLLHLLRERTLPSAGGKTEPIDVRILAASSCDLNQRVAQHAFKAELLDLLSGQSIRVPPLRERPEDIAPLLRHFAQLHARRCNKPVAAVPPAALAALGRYGWPGNVLEVSNLVERCVLLSAPGQWLDVRLTGAGSCGVAEAGPARTDLSLDDAQRQHIMRALAATNWVIAGATGAAARLGMKRTSLQYRMRKLGINRPDTQTA